MMNSKVIYVDFKNGVKKNSVALQNKQGIFKLFSEKLKNLFRFSSSNKPSGVVYNFKKTM